MKSVIQVGEAWPAQSGLAQVQFEHSLGTYWLEYVPEGGKFKHAIQEGMREYAREQYGLEPQFAFVNPIPPGANEFIEVQGVTIVLADWVQPRFVALGRGGTELISDEMRYWRKLA